MLRNMFIGDPPGNHDRLLDFSTAVTGNLFFVPTVDVLEGEPVPSSGDADTPGDSGAGPSLGIGDLRSRTP